MSATIRRRSAAISFSAVILSGGLAACEKPVEDKPMKVFATADECASSGEDWNTCNTTAKAAEVEHERTAPRFKSEAECFNETGGVCQDRVDDRGQHVFLPLMAGFMMGQMLNRGYVGHPLYYGRDGSYYSGKTRVWEPPPRKDDDRRGGSGGGGGFGGSGSAAARERPRQISAPLDSRGEVARPGSARRGGFGRTAGFRGSGGGGE